MDWLGQMRAPYGLARPDESTIRPAWVQTRAQYGLGRPDESTKWAG